MGERCRQIVLTVPNTVGKLAEVTDRIKEVDVNLLALCAWAEGERAKIMAVTRDDATVTEAVRPTVTECKTVDAVWVNVPNVPGALNELAHKLADAGIDIHSVYATVAGAAEAAAVFMTSDNERAARLI